jgi:diacylglycerol kinase (ATP)
MWHVILNPTAGRGQAESAWRAQQPRLEARGHRFCRVHVSHFSCLTEQVADLVQGGARQLLVIGGDGTHHHVVNGLMRQQACPAHEVDYALWPQGTGNDWVRTHRIPRRAAAWRQRFLQQQYRRQDVGLIEAIDFHGKPVQRYFTNVAGLGYDAFVVHYLQAKAITADSGLKYFQAIYACLHQFEAQPLRVQADEERWERTFYTLNVGLGKYSGGGMSFVPQADPQDGQLALTLVKNMPPWRIAIATPWLYTPFFDHHPMCIGRKAQTIAIEHLGSQPIWIEAEGELIGQTPAKFSVLPGALRFLG